MKPNQRNGTVESDPRKALNIERQERVERCGKAIEEALKRERVTLTVSVLQLIEGRVVPQIQLVATD